MIKRILDLFKQPTGPERESISPDLAAAALLVEVMAADDDWQDTEESTIRNAILHSLKVTEAECQELLSNAKSRHRDAHDLFEMTRQINDHFSPEKKHELILNMWKVAWADGEVDRYEDHTIRKIAELIYVPHEQFIKAKLEAKPS